MKLFGDEFHSTNALLLLIKIMLCSNFIARKFQIETLFEYNSASFMGQLLAGARHGGGRHAPGCVTPPDPPSQLLFTSNFKEFVYFQEGFDLILFSYNILHGAGSRWGTTWWSKTRTRLRPSPRFAFSTPIPSRLPRYPWLIFDDLHDVWLLECALKI